MMTEEEMKDRLTMLGNDLFSAEAPLCERTAAEADIEHEDIHKLAAGVALAAQMRGVQSAPEFVMVGFALGRKWGMIEAADLMGGSDA